jgi:DNA-binding XRE family transcriptional regulator
MLKIKLKNPMEFKKLMIVKGFSQADLAKAVEITPPYLNQIVNEERFPSAKTAKKISNVFGVEFADIFFISDACKSYQTR